MQSSRMRSNCCTSEQAHTVIHPYHVQYANTKVGEPSLFGGKTFLGHKGADFLTIVPKATLDSQETFPEISSVLIIFSFEHLQQLIMGHIWHSLVPVFDPRSRNTCLHPSAKWWVSLCLHFVLLYFLYVVDLMDRNVVLHLALHFVDSQRE